MRFLPCPAWLALFLALAVPAGSGLGAEEPALPLAAIGWLGHDGPAAGLANCTAVLIAPDVAVTADHCLIDPSTGAPAPAQSLTFIAGLDGQASAATRRGRAIVLAAETAPAAAASPKGYAPALLLLESPVAADLARPLPTAAGALSPGAATVTVGYPRQAQDRPVVQHGCLVTLASPPAIGLTCDAVSGFSGGAVLTLEDGAWTLAAIIVAEARSSEDTRTIAHSLRPGLVPGLAP
jgi:V8-like Glu-specific endopeptidase